MVVILYLISERKEVSQQFQTEFLQKSVSGDSSVQLPPLDHPPGHPLHRDNLHAGDQAHPTRATYEDVGRITEYFNQRVTGNLLLKFNIMKGINNSKEYKKKLSKLKICKAWKKCPSGDDHPLHPPCML